MRELIEAAGARLLYLPPYSPDFNPIENAFAKLNALLQKAAERTVEWLWRAIGRLMDEIAPTGCATYLPPTMRRDQASNTTAKKSNPTNVGRKGRSPSSNVRLICST